MSHNVKSGHFCLVDLVFVFVFVYLFVFILFLLYFVYLLFVGLFLFSTTQVLCIYIMASGFFF